MPPASPTCIGIEIEHVNFAAEYKDRVFAEFLREYQAGRTPNPDVLCNAEIKFKAFLDHAIRLGAERIATGHYARVRESASGPLRAAQGARRAEGPELLPAPPEPGAAGAARCFRSASSQKTEVRRIAAEIGLPNARKKDSTGICFIGERPFREFLNRYLANTPGPIEDDRGRTIGEHVGLSFYTLGQRKGIGIGGLKDPARHARRRRARALVRRAARTSARNVLHVVAGPRPPLAAVAPARRRRRQLDRRHRRPPTGRYAAKTRYRQADAACALRRRRGSGRDRARLRPAAMGRDAGPVGGRSTTARSASAAP